MVHRFTDTDFPRSRRDALKALAGTGAVLGTAGCIVAGDEKIVLGVGGGCREGGAYVYLTNDNDEPVELRLTGPDGYDETRTVGGSAGDANRFDDLDDGAYELESLHEDYRPSETSFVFHCDKEIAVSQTCVEREGGITVENHNDEPVDVRVTGPDGYDEMRSIAADSSGEYAGLEDGRYVLQTDHETIGLERNFVRIACDPLLRNLHVSSACRGDDGLLRVENDNDDAVDVRVTGPDGYDQTRSVGALDDVEFAGLENGRYEVEPDFAENGVDRMSVDVLCPTPAPVISVFPSCRGGRGVLTASHDGDDGVRVAVTGPDGYGEERVVGGPEQHVSFRDLEAGEYHVEIDDEGFRPSLTSFVVDCPPVLDVSHDCLGDDGRITVRNDNDEPVGVRATGPDGYDEARTVAAKRSVEFAGLEDGRYVLESDRGDVLAEPGVVRIGCGPTPVDLRKTSDCFGRCGRITVTNDNGTPVDVTASGPGGYAETKTVPADGTVEFRGLDNGRYELTTDRDDIGVHQPTLEIDCPREITVQDDCRDGNGEIRVSFDGESTGEVRVTGPDGYDETGTVGGSEQILSFGDLPDGEYQLEVLDERFRLERSAVVVDCQG